jgi:translation initiation factor 4E
MTDSTTGSSSNNDAALKEEANKPLHNKWVMWFDNPKTAKLGDSWMDNLQNTKGTFETPAQFWAMYNNLKPASKLSMGSNYHLFKDGIEPMWEDPQNQNGGKWVFTIFKKDPKIRRIDEWWLFTCLSLIGETLDLHGDQVCGAVVSIRKQQDRIALWLKTDDGELASQIGARWKLAMSIPNSLKYQVHRDGKLSNSL